MRRGHKNGWLETEDKQMVGINLGADYCAEHEWGTSDLRETLGVSDDKNVMGIERYRISNPKVEHIFLREENKNNAALICIPYAWEMKNWAAQKFDKLGHGELHIFDKEELATAWSGSDFGIRVKRPMNIKRLKRLHNAILNKEAAIWLGGGGVFQNAGLCIAIIDMVPENLKKQMYDAHVDRKKLEDASDATGIKKKIDAINNAHREKYKDNFSVAYHTPCGYMALSPAWIRDDQKGNSKYSVMYWLNPREQQKNHYGWFTVEELEQWMEGKGPIIERAKEEAEKRAKEKVS
jgi:hypothetical protein